VTRSNRNSSHSRQTPARNSRDLLDAASAEFDEGDDANVYGRDEDAELIESIIDDYDGYEYAGEYDCLGGVVVESDQSRVRINNTFDSVLEDVWEDNLQDQQPTLRTMSAGASNPEYVNARVRSRRATLFADEDYRKLIRMGPSEIARFMEETEYEREINELGTRFSGVDLIEYALNRNLAKHFDDLLEWSNGRLYDLIARYLRKFDVWNIKVIIRGIYTDSDPEEIRTDLIRAGELDERTIDRLVEVDEIDDVIELLDGSIFGEPLASATEAFEETGALIPLENALDRAFYENLLADLGRPYEGPEANYVEFLEAEIDFRNARNALRLAHERGRPRSGELLHRGRRPVQRVGAKPTHRRLRRARRSHRRKRPLRRPALGRALAAARS